jgi:hypothetical protein
MVRIARVGLSSGVLTFRATLLIGNWNAYR